jgi:hypothetical protein
MQRIQKNYLSNFEKNAQKTSKVLSKLTWMDLNPHVFCD